MQWAVHYEEAKWLAWWPAKILQLSGERQAFEKLVKTVSVTSEQHSLELLFLIIIVSIYLFYSF